MHRKAGYCSGKLCKRHEQGVPREPAVEHRVPCIFRSACCLWRLAGVMTPRISLKRRMLRLLQQRRLGTAQQARLLPPQYHLPFFSKDSWKNTKSRSVLPPRSFARLPPTLRGSPQTNPLLHRDTCNPPSYTAVPHLVSNLLHYRHPTRRCPLPSLSRYPTLPAEPIELPVVPAAFR